MKRPSKDIVTLAVGQALTGTVTSLLTSVSSLSGARLAPSPALSTMPVTSTLLGALIMIYPASHLMAAMGRRNGFVLKAGVGIAGGIACCAAMVIGSFLLLVLGAFLLGIFSAFGQYYRFAAFDAARTSEERTAAVSMVTGAGVAGGIAGPYIGSHGLDWFGAVPYADAFLSLSLVCVALALSQMFLSRQLGVAPTAAPGAAAEPARLGRDFYLASAVCACGFAVMTLVMNAAPLSIHHAGHGLHASALVMQTHFALMYLPSFINPLLVARLKLRGLTGLGVLIGIGGCLLALYPQQSLDLYMLELGLAGMGWNFIFNGGTLLLAGTYPEAMKTRAQGVNSILVFGANIAASLLAGVLFDWSGWSAVNLACLPLLALTAWLLLWAGRSPRRSAVPA
jgi:MFS family permease